MSTPREKELEVALRNSTAALAAVMLEMRYSMKPDKQLERQRAIDEAIIVFSKKEAPCTGKVCESSLACVGEPNG